MAKHRLSRGHDGPKAGANIASGAQNGGSDDRGGSPSPPPTPTTLVPVVSSSTAPVPVRSSLTGGDNSGEQDGDGKDGECGGEDAGEL